MVKSSQIFAVWFVSLSCLISSDIISDIHDLNGGNGDYSDDFMTQSENNISDTIANLNSDTPIPTPAHLNQVTSPPRPETLVRINRGNAHRHKDILTALQQKYITGNHKGIPIGDGVTEYRLPGYVIQMQTGGKGRNTGSVSAFADEMKVPIEQVQSMGRSLSDNISPMMAKAKSAGNTFVHRVKLKEKVRSAASRVLPVIESQMRKIKNNRTLETVFDWVAPITFFIASGKILFRGSNYLFMTGIFSMIIASKVAHRVLERCGYEGPKSNIGRMCVSAGKKLKRASILGVGTIFMIFSIPMMVFSMLGALSMMSSPIIFLIVILTGVHLMTELLSGSSRSVEPVKKSHRVRFQDE